METQETSEHNGVGFTGCSHSLGTLIEWKRRIIEDTILEVAVCSHSLGTLIEWKLEEIFNRR